MPARASRSRTAGTPRLGLSLAPAGDVEGAGQKGVVVTEVDPQGPAARARHPDRRRHSQCRRQGRCQCRRCPLRAGAGQIIRQAQRAAAGEERGSDAVRRGAAGLSLALPAANSKGGLRAAFFVRVWKIPTGADNILVNGSVDDGFVRKSRVRSSQFGITCWALASMKTPRRIAGVELRTPGLLVEPVVRI